MTKKEPEGPRLFHPLSGCNVTTLFNVLTTNGALPANRLPHAAVASLATLGRFPFYTLEKLYVEFLKNRRPPMKPPIFIVGHWRGGTTHLYNVMVKSDTFGFVPPLATGLPWDLLGIATVFRPFLEKALPEGRFIDNVPVKPDSPQEDEIALANMTPLSFYHGLYFPTKFEENFNRGVFFDGCTQKETDDWKKIFVYFMEKMSLHQGGKQLLIKNPTYTARVKMLHEMYPNAKFIHIHRNPYMVFPSMKNFYVKLFKELALQPYDHVDIDDFVLKTYPRVIGAVLEDSKALPENKFIEISHEDMEQDPLPVLERVYTQLEMPGFDEAKPKFEAYLASVQNYQKNTYSYPEEITKRVQDNWGAFIDRWGYAPPA